MDAPGAVAEMDLDTVRGILLVTLMLAFLGLWAWAWSKKRKPDFDRASRMPLEEDNGRIPEHKGVEE